MPRFSINVSFMLHEHDFLDRFAAAADFGFRGVDLQFPYDHPAEQVAARARAAGVEVVLINLPAGDPATGELGIAALPGRQAEFQDGIARGLEYCRALGATRVNVLAGVAPARLSRDSAMDVLAANLARAADAFGANGITVMVEAINGRDAPGFFIQTTEDALAAIRRADRPNLKLQFDLYHRQVMQGDLIPALERHLPDIAHIQFADTPGRHEPGTGEINFDRVFAALDRLGYDGWVGAEYRPSGTLRDSLAWFDRRRG